MKWNNKGKKNSSYQKNEESAPNSQNGTMETFGNSMRNTYSAQQQANNQWSDSQRLSMTQRPTNYSGGNYSRVSSQIYNQDGSQMGWQNSGKQSVQYNGQQMMQPVYESSNPPPAPMPYNTHPQHNLGPMPTPNNGIRNAWGYVGDQQNALHVVNQQPMDQKASQPQSTNASEMYTSADASTGAGRAPVEHYWKGNLHRIPLYDTLKIGGRSFVGMNPGEKAISVGRGTFGTAFLGRLHEDWLGEHGDNIGPKMLDVLKRPLVLKRQAEKGREARVASEAQALELLTNSQSHLPQRFRLAVLAFGYFRLYNAEGHKRHHLLMECAPGGDFHKVVKNCQFTDRQIIKIANQVLAGIRFCHYNGVVHRDIKTHNFLMSLHGNLLLSDFGLCATTDGPLLDTKFSKFVGTVIFCAPEQRWTLENSSSGGGEKPPDSFVRGQHPTTSNRPEVYEYDYRADIFAVGVVLYNCATKSIPGLSLAQKHEFEEEMKNSNDVERKKVRARLVTTLNMVQHVSQQLKDKTAEHFPHHFQNQDLKDMMFKLLDCNPKSRISVEEIMDHRAFSETQGGRQIDLFTPSDLENMKIYSKLNKYRAVYHSEMVEENFKPKAHQIEWGYRDPTKPKPAEADAFQVTQLEPDYITQGEYFFNACNVPVQYVGGSNHGTPTNTNGMNNNNNQNNSKQKFYDQQNNMNNGGNNMQYAGAPQYGMYNNFMQPAQQQ